MTPAGWYNDPEGTGQLRWWDGTAWTQHRQPVPQQQMAQQFSPQARTTIEPGIQPGFQQSGWPSQQYAGLGTTIPNSQSPPQSPLLILVWVGLVGMAIGPFLNWLTVSVSDQSFSIKGTKSAADTWMIGSLPDGYLVLGIAALVLAAAIAYNGKNSASAASWIALLGVAGIALLAASYFAFKSKFADRAFSAGLDLRPGVGMWVAATGSILIVIGGMATRSTAAKVITQ